MLSCISYSISCLSKASVDRHYILVGVHVPSLTSLGAILVEVNCTHVLKKVAISAAAMQPRVRQRQYSVVDILSENVSTFVRKTSYYKNVLIFPMVIV